MTVVPRRQDKRDYGCETYACGDTTERKVIGECKFGPRVGGLNTTKLQIGEHEYRSCNGESQRKLSDHRRASEFCQNGQHSPLTAVINQIPRQCPTKCN